MGSPQDDLALSVENEDGCESFTELSLDDVNEENDYYANQPGDAISNKANKRKNRKGIAVVLMISGILAIIFAIGAIKASKDMSMRGKSTNDKYTPGDERDPKLLDPLQPNDEPKDPNYINPTTTSAPKSSPASSIDLWNFLATTLHQEALLEESSIYYDAFKWLEGDEKLSTYDENQIKQRYVFACLYMATNLDDNWSRSDRWMSSDDECAWFGIFCDVEGRVLELNLTDNGLVGTVPQQMAFLSDSLLTLELHKNNVVNNDEELAWLGQLTNLLAMDIRETEFSFSGIPHYLSHLTSIRVLEIASTGFSGAIDGSIFEPMKDLVYLDMGGNLYNSTLPMEIARLPALEALYLDNTNLYGNIGFISEMNSPYEIWLDNNPNLAGSIPTEIGKLSGLASLSITNCGIIGTLPSELGNLAEMQQMWLSGNYIIGSVPSEIGSLKKLRIFQTEDNYISGDMPSDVCDLFGADNLTGLIALGADCEPPGEVRCTCCTCCSAPCEVVNIPTDRRKLHQIMDH